MIRWFYQRFVSLQVLLSNSMACQLLGFKSNQLQKLTLDDFVLDPEKGRGIHALVETEIIHDDQEHQATPAGAINGGKLLVAGKVVSWSGLSHQAFCLRFHLLYSRFLKGGCQNQGRSNCNNGPVAQGNRRGAWP